MFGFYSLITIYPNRRVEDHSLLALNERAFDRMEIDHFLYTATAAPYQTKGMSRLERQWVYDAQ